MRGDCTQPCRLAYDLVDEAGQSVVAVEGDRLLCPHDYLGIAHLPELVDAGVASLKIEGRMKNPDYVFNVVRVWRRALDMLCDGAWDPVPWKSLSASWEGRLTVGLPMRTCEGVRVPS